MKTLLFDHLDYLLENTMADICFKDFNGKYVEINATFEKHSKLCRHDIIGNSDFDFWLYSEAELMNANDKKVLAVNNTIKTFEKATVDGIENKFLNIKQPLKSKSGKTLGVVGFAFKCYEDEDFFKKYNEITAPLNFNPSLLTYSNQKSHCFDLENTKHNKKTEYKDLLSPKQYDCLYFLVKGMSAKQIARILNLSHRTIEDYFDRLKVKFNCKNRFELISQALKLPVIVNRLFLDSLNNNL